MVKKTDIGKPKEKIITGDMKEYMTNDYRDYSLYVLKNRAIPLLYTGLKPIQTKLMYAMRDMGIKSNLPYRKCKPVVGHTTFFSVHGDTSIEGAIVNLAQWFGNYCPLIDGYGNFGHVNGAENGALRYLECRLTQYAEKILLDDLSKYTVDWTRNYDDTRDEPLYLPAKLPNLLVNGSSGLAIGFRTNWVTHNPVDVIATCSAFVKDRKISIEELIDILGAPDFPTGGLINGLETVKTAYMTGSGSVLVRGEYTSHTDGLGYTVVNITSIPYGTNTSNIKFQIAQLADNEKILLKRDGLNDLTSEKVNIELILKKEEDLNRAMNIIFKETDLESRIPMIHNALIFNEKGEKKFVTLNLRDMIKNFVEFRENVIYRRLSGELKDKSHRVHMIDGVLIISGDIEKTVKTVQASSGRNDAIEKLMKAFKKEKLDREQAEYIVDLKLYRLNKLDIGEMRAEKKTLEDRITLLIKWTASKSNKHIDKIMLDEWQELLDGLFKGYKRKSRIIDYVGIKTSDIIKDDPKRVVLTKDGYILKCDPGKMPDNYIRYIESSELKPVVFTSMRGKMFLLNTHQLPEDGRGKLPRNIMNLSNSDEIINFFTLSEKDIITTITQDGMIKLSKAKDILTLGKSGRVVHTTERSKVVWSGIKLSDDILVGSIDGKVVRTDISDVKPTGVGGVGVGIMDGQVTSAVFIPKGCKDIRYMTDKKTGVTDIRDIRKIKRNTNAVGVYLTGKKIFLRELSYEG